MQLVVITSEPRYLAGEPKHFPFAIVFIIKNPFTLHVRLVEKTIFGKFSDDFRLSLVIVFGGGLFGWNEKQHFHVSSENQDFTTEFFVLRVCALAL